MRYEVDIATGETTEHEDAAPLESAPRVPGVISDRQFFQALALPPYEVITQEEALAAVRTGAIPTAMQAMSDALPAEAQFSATMHYRRRHGRTRYAVGCTPASRPSFPGTGSTTPRSSSPRAR